MRRPGWRAAVIGVLFSLATTGVVWASPDETAILYETEERAADTENTGTAAEPDPQTQVFMQALLSAASGEEGDAGISPDFQIEYDAGQDMYEYLLDGTVWFAASAPKDSITTDPVRIQVGESQSILSVRRNDGTLKTSGDASDRRFLLLTEPGSYDISVYSRAGMDELLTKEQVGAEEMERMLSSVQRLNLHYQIVSKKTGALETVNPPDGFQLVSADYEGNILPVSDQTQFLEKDGTYRFQFAAQSDPEVIYMLAFDLDRTAPYLAFEGKMDGLEGHAPVKVTASEKDAVITVRSSAGTYSFSGPEGTLSAADSYWLTVKDPLGNERSYRLFLAQSDRRIWKLLGLAAAGILLGILSLYMKIQGEKTDEVR